MTVQEQRDALLRDIHIIWCEASAVRARLWTPQVVAHQVEQLVAERLDALVAAVRADARAPLEAEVELLREAWEHYCSGMEERPMTDGAAP